LNHLSKKEKPVSTSTEKAALVLSADRLETARIMQVVEKAADTAYRIRVRRAMTRRIEQNGMTDLLEGKNVANGDILRQNGLARRVREHGLEELIQSRREAGINVHRWLALRRSTREAASPEEFQTFARVLGVSPRWLAVGSGDCVDHADNVELQGFEQPPVGWETFGSHVDRPEAQLEFSSRLGEDSLPLWERERELV
jgi:hypothetical protein